MVSLQNAKLRASQSQSYPSYDYYSYDYGYPAMQSIQRMGSGKSYNNPRLGRFGAGAGAGGSLYGGYSGTNTYNGYGDYGGVDYSSGYSGSPAQSKSSVGSYSGGYNDCPGIPIALLLVTLLGIGVMGFILFTKIQGAGRRKREARVEDDAASWTMLLPELETLDVILLHGRGV